MEVLHKEQSVIERLQDVLHREQKVLERLQDGFAPCTKGH